MQVYPDFTLCAFPDAHRKALALLGAKSGRDGDKIAEAGVTPCQSQMVSSPAFEEANLIFECRKMYSDDFRPEQFLDPAIEGVYTKNDYHTIYYGEILTISGDRTLYTWKNYLEVIPESIKTRSIFQIKITFYLVKQIHLTKDLRSNERVGDCQPFMTLPFMVVPKEEQQDGKNAIDDQGNSSRREGRHTRDPLKPENDHMTNA